MKAVFSCAVLLLSAVLAYATIDSSLQMQLGNPSNATADPNNHTHYLIQRSIEALDYNDTLGEANWASWDLTAGDANGAVARQDSFAADASLPSGFHLVGPNDYSHSGYDRGHLCPSADRTDTTNDNDLTFLMSNMMPQTSANNSGVWGNFESYCRSLVQSTNNYELLIICGPSGFTGAKINTNGYVSIPQYTWKIAVVVPPGAGTAASRITATNRVIAIKIPNTNGVSSAWQNFVTSASQIQVDTGLTFFTALNTNIAAALRARVDGQTNPPPAIYAFSPGDGVADTNVVITGTNFTMTSAVAFNGVNATFTVNSGLEITAIVPTNASSGFISVTTPDGTAISATSFTVDGGLSVYNGILAGWDTSGLGSYGPSPLAAIINAAQLAVVGLTRGTGVKTSGSGATNAWGGVGFTNLTAAAAVGSNQFVAFSITASNGYQVSFTSVSRFDYYRSPTGPTDGVLQFQVGTGGFTDITNLSYPTASSGTSIGAIDLSGFGALQNVGANTNVTFRIVNFNGGSAGTWYVYDKAGNIAPDLALTGTVTQVLTATNPPAAMPVISLSSYANNQFQFTVTGATGSNYVVQAATNLTMPDWVPIWTNTAPFVFTQSNADQFPQRFFRAIAP